MTRSFHACNSPTHEGKTNTWFTPKNILDKLGKFDLDPCTESFRPFDTAKKHYCFDLGDDGLSLPWDGRIWLNPPYGLQISKWLDKLLEHGNGIALTYSRTDTRWAQKHLKACQGCLFLKGRISFIYCDGKTKANNAANGSMLIAYGKENVKYLKNLEGVLIGR